MEEANYPLIDRSHAGQQIDKVYLSGKMSGLLDHGFSLFKSATNILRNNGFQVFDPSETDNGDTSQPRPYYLRKDIHAICDWAEAVVVLSNWRMSAGAILEVHIANELEMPVFDYDRSCSRHKLVEITAENILEEANRLVTGDRNIDYGHPFYDYDCTVDLFNRWMKKKHGGKFPETGLSAEDATMFMVFMKLSREANKSKRDSVVDSAGYLWCYDSILQKKRELGLLTP